MRGFTGTRLEPKPSKLTQFHLMFSFYFQKKTKDVKSLVPFFHLLLKRLIPSPLGPFPWARFPSCGSNGLGFIPFHQNGTPVMPIWNLKVAIIWKISFLHFLLKRLIPGPPGPFPWARAQSRVFSGASFIPIGPNGTPVMPIWNFKFWRCCPPFTKNTCFCLLGITIRMKIN